MKRNGPSDLPIVPKNKENKSYTNINFAGMPMTQVWLEIPADLWEKICSMLSSDDLQALAQVDKTWLDYIQKLSKEIIQGNIIFYNAYSNRDTFLQLFVKDYGFYQKIRKEFPEFSTEVILGALKGEVSDNLYQPNIPNRTAYAYEIREQLYSFSLANGNTHPELDQMEFWIKLSIYIKALKCAVEFGNPSSHVKRILSGCEANIDPAAAMNGWGKEFKNTKFHALLNAVKSGNVHIVKVLLKDTGIDDYMRSSAMDTACVHGNLEAAKAILDISPNVHLDARTLVFAAKNNNTNCVKLLLALAPEKFSVEHKNKALAMARAGEHIAVITAIEEHLREASLIRPITFSFNTLTAASNNDGIKKDGGPPSSNNYRPN